MLHFFVKKSLNLPTILHLEIVSSNLVFDTYINPYTIHKMNKYHISLNTFIPGNPGNI